MEGALSRHVAGAAHTSKRCSLPDYLAIHRTKIILNRLPTRQERSRRHDTHANGELISPYCPHCPQEIETHAHALVTCPHNNSNVNSFQYNLNKSIRDTTSTLFKKGNADARWAQTMLTSDPSLPFKIIPGWQTAYKDKHGRTQKTGHGPDIVQSTTNGKTLHPTLFRAKCKHLERDHIQQAFQQTPRDTIDMHWIRAIIKHLPTQRLYSAIDKHPSHPDSRNLTQLHREEDPPSIHGYCLWDAHSTHINDDTNLINRRRNTHHIQPRTTVDNLQRRQDQRPSECGNYSRRHPSNQHKRFLERQTKKHHINNQHHGYFRPHVPFMPAKGCGHRRPYNTPPQHTKI